MFNLLKKTIIKSIPLKYRPIYKFTDYTIYSFDLNNKIYNRLNFDHKFVDNISDYIDFGGDIPSNLSNEYEEAFSKNGKLLCVKYKQKLAHVSWFSTTHSGILFDSIFKTGILKDNSYGYIGPCETYPEFRGKGIYPFALKKICEYQKKCGIKKVLINSRSNNNSSIKGIIKSGFVLNSKVKSFELLGNKYLKLKKISEKT